MSRQNAILFVSIAVLFAAQIPAVTALQSVTSANPATDWPMFSHDLAATRFSQLKQINAGNVSKLKLAWSMPYRADRTSTAAGGLGGLTEATPVVVNGVMYLPAENCVMALDAATGKEIWKFDVAPGGPGGALSRRGVTYWPGET